MDAGHVFLVRPNPIHLADVEIAKCGVKRVIRFVHFFDALFQHARLLSGTSSRMILSSRRRGEELQERGIELDLKGCPKSPDFSPAQPWRAETRLSQARPQQISTPSQKGGLGNPRLRASNDITDPSKLARCFFRDGG